MKNYAIILGVDKYSHAMELPCCANDAHVIEGLLAATEKYEILRIPGDATKDKVLSGLVFCGDCGNKMYHVRCKGWDHSQEYFTCATYRKQRGGCTSHQIKTEVIEQIVLAQLQSIIHFASYH